MSFDKSIDKETLNELPLKVFEGPIHVIDKRDGISKTISSLKGRRFLGFDTETRPSFKKGKKNQVALLQLATPEETFLFRLNKIGLPDELKMILADPDIIKIGAAIHDDIKSLQKINSFNPKGFTDLQNIVRKFGIESLSLKKLAAIVLNFRISKSQQLTNWDAEELTEAQQKYAAMDAWVSLQIFLQLRKEIEYSDKLLADVIK